MLLVHGFAWGKLYWKLFGSSPVSYLAALLVSIICQILSVFHLLCPLMDRIRYFAG